MSIGRADKLIRGTVIAQQVFDQLRRQVESIRAESGKTPTLATVLVGDDPASHAYLVAKDKRCAEAGIVCRRVTLSPDTTTESLVAAVTTLANDAGVHAILVQHPIPEPLDKRAAFEAIPLAKDVDGVSSASLGRVILGMPAFPSCTPAGIMRLLRAYNVPLDGADAVVVGRSPILGRPMASMLINAHATVTLCHSRSRDLPGIIRRADVLIVAVGKPRFVQGDWIKSGAVVIDAGYNESNIGDVDFQSAATQASLITPVPGGVGPMTIATLLVHTVQAAAAQLGVNLPDQ
jgi:methylenetetrahydrofolate dehydrogenase (NADP+)/methenyltetrahydrofolate cyclohydrolase